MGENKPYLIMKFGGTSVANPQNWAAISTQIKERLSDHYKIVVVCSALSGVSNMIESLIKRKGVAKWNVDEIQNDFIRRHESLASHHKIDHLQVLQSEFEEFKSLLLQLKDQKISYDKQARMMSLGELCSTKLVTAFLSQEYGIQNQWMDAKNILKVSFEAPVKPSRKHFLDNMCDCAHSKQNINESAFKQDVIVTQGFFGADLSGNTVLFGRGGSDTSATAMGAVFDAKFVEIWTDVPGVFVVDPRQFPKAKQIKKLSYKIAEVMSEKGVKVLHRKCIQPAKDNKVPIVVKDISQPHLKGTSISDDHSKIKSGIMGMNCQSSLVWVKLTHELFHADIIKNISAYLSQLNYRIKFQDLTVEDSWVGLIQVDDDFSSDEFLKKLSEIDSECSNLNLEYENIFGVSFVGESMAELFNNEPSLQKFFQSNQKNLILKLFDQYSVSLFFKNKINKDLNKMIDSCSHFNDSKVFGEAWQQIQSKQNKRVVAA